MNNVTINFEISDTDKDTIIAQDKNGEIRRNSEQNQKEMRACGNAATGGLALYLQRQAFFLHDRKK